jgi:uncharacterized membrane protein
MLTISKKLLYILFAALCIIIGLYPTLYFIMGRQFGMLSDKPQVYTSAILWNAGFYTHITFGAIALLTGWIQFIEKWRNTNLALHRKIGKVYVAAVLLSSLAGIGIGFFATGGYIAALGFISLGLFWFSATLRAYIAIKNRQIDQHKKMMIYSYAACFAAVTLRIWLPVLIMIFGDFFIAYKIVAWLCWVPNIIVAWFIVKASFAKQYNYSYNTVIDE